MAYLCFETHFTLRTDASYNAVVYILAQKMDGKSKVFGYGGRALNEVESRYRIVEKEGKGLKKYHCYLYHAKYRIYG